MAFSEVNLDSLLCLVPFNSKACKKFKDVTIRLVKKH